MAGLGFTLSIENLDGFCRIKCGGRFDEDMFMHLVNMMRKDLVESDSPKRYLVDLRDADWRPEFCLVFPAADYVSRELGPTRVALVVSQELLDGLAGIPSAEPGLPVLFTRFAEEALAWIAAPGSYQEASR